MGGTTKRIRVQGRVQGVFYRGWTVEQARALGLAGWVRNRRDGSVEILAAGSEAGIDALIERCRQGPPSAVVASVDVEESDEQVPAGFTQLPTL